MKTRPATLLGLALGSLSTLAVVASMNACSTPVRGRPFDPAAPVFPSTSGENLNGRKIDVPGGFDAPFNILFVAFLKEQQDDVNTWLPTAKALVADHANVEYYELPTVSGAVKLGGSWLDNAMRRGIPAFADRERTITLYVDTDEFRRLAGIEGRERIWVGVVDRQGRVYWSTRGRATDAALQELRRIVDETASPEAARIRGGERSRERPLGE